MKQQIFSQQVETLSLAPVLTTILSVLSKEIIVVNEVADA